MTTGWGSPESKGGEETDVQKEAGISGDTPSPAALSSLHTLPGSDKPERKPTMQDCPCDGSSRGSISKRLRGPHRGPGPQAKATPVSLPSWEWEESGPALSCLPPWKPSLSTGLLFTRLCLWLVGICPLSD
ncbi:hCG2045601 [Homo sapiens]|uniref:HCG2045601 n=1 Tax=Homo sapiens TaxID=9606 RepID=Q6ZSH9_HUMAN|nr:hCG2045601 [Homo sapiens]BAC86972.1 unnamed protein product [Homo sapiens]|eukprot:NP_001229720.1 uncharacterized protein LOC729220 [Homo sapiens]